MPWFQLNLVRRVRRITTGDRRGVVAIFFALALVPLILVVALAVDVSFYVQATSQLNLAADAAAMHAVRVASSAYSEGKTTLAAAEAAGTQAGQQWFASQLGSITSASVPAVSVNVTYQPSPPGFVASVTYSGSVPTHLGSFIVPSWTISGNSGSIVQNAYLEVIMLMDNSSSMLIGATNTDIQTLEQATPCSRQSASAGQPMQWEPAVEPPNSNPNYSWIYLKGTDGYGNYVDPITGKTLNYSTPVAGADGHCDTAKFTGTASSCPDPATISGIQKDGTCATVGGVAGGVSGVPQSPCGLACHNDAGGNDYYGLARTLGVTLRLDVVHQAAAQVIETMQSYEEVAGQYSVGVYEFNSTLQQQYPPAGGGEASTDLATALTTVEALNPPVTLNSPQTYFSTTASALASSLTPAGDGTTAAAPLKNIIIVTDGVEDDQIGGIRTIAPITSPASETICQKFKDLGFTVFVLYTTYLPLPNEFYLNSGLRAIAEPTDASAVTAALMACASSPKDFFSASDPADIKAAMQNILTAALNGPGRVTK